MNPLHVDRSNPLLEETDFEEAAFANPLRTYPRDTFGQRRVFASEERAERAIVLPRINVALAGTIVFALLGVVAGLMVKAWIF